MKVLFLNHTGEMSGAERALLDLVEVGAGADYDPVVACPAMGPLADAVRALSVPVVDLPEVRLSFRIHPWRTGQGLAELSRGALAVRRLAAQQHADLIHANSTRAGLIAAPAAFMGRPPVLVHVHDCLPLSRAGRLTRRVIGASADVVVTNSSYTAANFAPRGCRARVRVVHDCVDTERFRPRHVSHRRARGRLGLPPGGPVLGLVAQLTPWKAQDDAISMLARLRERRPGAQLLLVGSAKFAAGFTRYDNPAFERALRAAASQLGLDSAVHFLGQRDDLPEILPALDLLILPSWEEPFGIALLEAMATELPVLATSVGGPADIITHGENGFLLPPRQPDLWAREIDALVDRRALLAEVGRQARLRALEFSRRRYVDGVLASYTDALSGSVAA